MISASAAFIWRRMSSFDIAQPLQDPLLRERARATEEAVNVIKEHPWFLLAALVDSCQDAIISKDLNGTVTSWNPAATRMYGYEPEEMIGQPVARLIPPESQDEEPEILRKVTAGERIERYEAVRVAKNGTRLDVSLTISPIRDNTGRIIGISKIARDISDRKKMEKLQLESEKLAATGRMAATIAHEINNPLEAVMNLIYLARHSLNEDVEAYGFLQTAEREVERVSHIAQLTLGYYRDRGIPTEIELHRVIDEVLTVYQAKLFVRDIIVERQFEGSRPIQVNKGEMIQVFSNVIANSIEAMPQGGALRVQILSYGDDGLKLIFEDQGTGIEEKHLSRIFEPFFTTKQDFGTGIGLWVTKRLIESRGGSIRVASCTTPGKSGTKVEIDLPFQHVHHIHGTSAPSVPNSEEIFDRQAETTTIRP